MIQKKRRLLVLLFFLVWFSFIAGCSYIGYVVEEQKETETKTSTEATEEPIQSLQAGDFFTQKDVIQTADEQTGETTTDISNWEGSYQIENELDFPENSYLETILGTLTGIKLTNPWFYDGALISGEILSYRDGNNVYFKSYFDDAKFRLEMNEGDIVRIISKEFDDGFGIKIKMAQGDVLKQGFEGDVIGDFEYGGIYTFTAIGTFITAGEYPYYEYYENGKVKFYGGDYRFTRKKVVDCPAGAGPCVVERQI